ncbi:MAG: hypothetical protein QXF69_08425, partial [Thermofilaceae archaeon]
VIAHSTRATVHDYNGLHRPPNQADFKNVNGLFEQSAYNVRLGLDQASGNPFACAKRNSVAGHA